MTRDKNMQRERDGKREMNGVCGHDSAMQGNVMMGLEHLGYRNTKWKRERERKMEKER